MSNSGMLGVYNSSPDKLQLTISTMDEQKGRFTGKFKAPNGVESDISGGFNFNKAENRTDLSFTTSEAKWQFYVGYNSDKQSSFEDCTGGEYKNDAVTGQWHFYKDLSGGGGGDGMNIGSGSVQGYHGRG